MLSTNARQAHVLAPWDGRITAQLAEDNLGVDLEPDDQAAATNLARMALRQDPTAVSAVTTLGLLKQLHGDLAGARRTFAYSEVLSRRDLRAQLWEIEDAVSRGDISGALKHYDIALRFSNEASAILFPILASAVSEPSVRSAAIRTLNSRPPWAPLFIEFIAGRGSDPRAAALVLQSLRGAGQPVPGFVRALLTQRLESLGLVGDAWRFYASFRPGVRSAVSRDPQFTADLTDPAVFDWQSVATDGRTATIQHGHVDLSAPSSVGGPLIQQMQNFPPGAYRLEGHSVAIDQPEASLPYWQLTCGNGQQLERIIVPSSALNRGNFTGMFNVPNGCPLQILALIAPPSNGPTGFSGQIDRTQVEPNGLTNEENR